MAEVSKELQDKAYEAVEIARKTGKLKKGTNEVTKAIEKGNAKLVIVADDVNPAEVIMHLSVLCEEKQVPCVNVKSRSDLGAAAGLQVATASVAITQEGESAEVIKEIKAQLKSS